MWDRRMIGVPNCPGKKTIYMELPAGWSADSIAPRRQADLGYPILTYVTVIAAEEAARVNARFKHQAAETLRVNLAEKGVGYLGQDNDESAVRSGIKVDEVLEAIEQDGYFSSWVVIEECTLD